MNTNKEITLVFLHGWGMNQGIWTRFCENYTDNLPNNVRCQKLDLLGYGTQINASEIIPDSDKLGMSNMTDNIANNIPHNSVLIAWSLSGLVAQTLVNNRCKNVIGHIQVCSTPKFVEDENWPGIKKDVLELFATQLEQDHQALLKRFIAIQCMGQSNARGIAKHMFDSINAYPLAHSDTLKKGLDILASSDLRLASSEACLDSNKELIPCLRVFGALDSLVPKKVIPKIEQLFKNDSVHCIKKASHAPFISHPEECEVVFNAYLQQHFLSDLPSGQSDLRSGQSNL